MTTVWIVIIAAILVAEAIALLDRKPGNTLSEHVWRWAGVKGDHSGNPIHWRIRRAVLLILMVWLTIHFVSGGAI